MEWEYDAKMVDIEIYWIHTCIKSGGVERTDHTRTLLCIHLHRVTYWQIDITERKYVISTHYTHYYYNFYAF